MTTTILSALCAIALGTGSISATTDTVNVYTVDYQQVKNFDGSQLIGKKIESYTINTLDAIEPEKVVKVHFIITDAATAIKESDPQVIFSGQISEGQEPSIKIVQVNPNVLPPTFIVDGKIVSKDYVDKLKPKNISSMEILKGSSGAEVCEKYGILPASSGIVLIHTKK